MHERRSGTRLARLVTLLTGALASCSGVGTTVDVVDDPLPTLAVTTTALPDGVLTVAYGQGLQASGGDGSYAWTVATGSLPAGLSLATGGQLSGVPTATGLATFTVQASSGDGQSATQGLTIGVTAPPLALATTSLPNGSTASAYSQSLQATGGDGVYAWTVIGGSLPAGLTMASGGQITGTPLAAGSSTFTAQVSSGDGQTASRALTLAVTAPTLTVTTASLPNGALAVAYSQGLQASGGNGSYTWTVATGSLPSGLSLASAGQITGTPLAAGSSSFTVQVASGGQTATRALTIVVAAPALSVTTTSLPNGVQGVSYGTRQLTATGGNGSYAWSIVTGSLPAGLTLSAGGAISGTPSAAGTATFTVRVTSAGLNAQRQLSITVTAPTGQTIYFTETFEDTNAAARGWFANTNFVLTTAQKVSGARSLEWHFLPGQQTPVFGGGSRILFPATETVYVSYWVKYSSNWIGSGDPAHPHEFTLITNEDDQWVGPSFTRLTANIEHNYQNGVRPRISITDAANIDQSRVGVDLSSVTESRGAAGCNGNTDGYSTNCYQFGGTYYNGKEWDAAQPVLFNQPGAANQNDWHFVEAYFQLNSIQGGIGQTDGIAQYWLDGVLLIDVQTALFRTGVHPNMGFFELIISPYIGSGSPVDQTAWVDDLRVGNRR